MTGQDGCGAADARGVGGDKGNERVEPAAGDGSQGSSGETQVGSHRSAGWSRSPSECRQQKEVPSLRPGTHGEASRGDEQQASGPPGPEAVPFTFGKEGS